MENSFTSHVSKHQQLNIDKKEAWIEKQRQAVLLTNYHIKDDPLGIEVVGVLLELKKKLYFFKYTGIDFEKGEVVRYIGDLGTYRKAIVAVPKAKLEVSKVITQRKVLEKIE